VPGAGRLELCAICDHLGPGAALGRSGSTAVSRNGRMSTVR
jgi:hypothetical protein